MKNTLIWWVFGTVFSVLAAGAVHGAPLAPVELRVSDTSQWTGDLVDSDMGEVAGVSTHPYFCVRHLADGTPSPATKLKVQVATDQGFTTIHWDSGFVGILSTAHLGLTPRMAYAGPGLQRGQTYYWRAAVMDAENAASPYSTAAIMHIAESGSGTDLRVTTGVGTEERQGNPVRMVSWPPAFTAEFIGEPGGPAATLAYIDVALDANFERIIWSESEISIGSILPGQRISPIPFTGTNPGSAAFWRIRFDSAEANYPWSTATSSFLHALPDPSVPSPGGFAREMSPFGTGSAEIASITAGDVNANGTKDVVVLSSVPNASHALYPDAGTATPGSPIPFGESAGGRAFALIRDFDLDGQSDVVVVDQAFVGFYVVNGAGGLSLIAQISVGSGEPVGVQAHDMNGDGWPDVVVAYEHSYVTVYGSLAGFVEFETFDNTGSPVTDILVTDFNLDDELCEVWLVAGGSLQLYRGFGWLEQSWQVEGATSISLADEGNTALQELVLAGPHLLAHCSLVVDGGAGELSLTVDYSVEHGFVGLCADVAGRDLTGDGVNDVVLVVDGQVSIWRGTLDTYEMHEYIDHPGGIGVPNVALADMNGDTFPDVLVGHANGAYGIFFNKPRVGVSIGDTSAAQVMFGEAYAEFEVILDTAPVSMVEVFCETYEEVESGGGGDDDAIPDVGDFLEAQSVSYPYYYTQTRLVFVPGQTVARFRVRLRKYHISSLWTLRARITSAFGAYLIKSTAAGTILSVPPSSGSSMPSSGPGMQRDWKIDGEVRDVLPHANGNTYFGGSFNSVSWDAQNLVALSETGERRLKMPDVSGSVLTVAVHPDGDVFFGGLFTIYVNPSLTIKNIAQCDPNGNLKTTFAPNPNGVINSIVFDGNHRVYFGGCFSELEIYGAMPFNNVAQVFKDTGAYTGPHPNSHKPNRIRAGNTSGEVRVLKIANSGVSDYLLIGGSNLTKGWVDTAEHNISNFFGVPLSSALGSGSSHVVTTPRFYGGSVNAIEVNETGPQIGVSSLSNAMFIGGDFDSSSVSGPYIVATNFSGYQLPASYFPDVPSPVNALKLDNQGHLWVGRGVNGWDNVNVNPLAIYSIAGSGLTLVSTIAADNAILSLAEGDGEMAVGGYFSTVAGFPASRIAYLSTAGTSLGALISSKSASVSGIGVRTVVPVYESGNHIGYVAGGSISGVSAIRKNLAAMDAQGHLLEWGPRTNAPVNALETDGNRIFFGGSFTEVSGVSRSSLASAFADDTSTTAETNWSADVSGTVWDLSLGNGHLIVGGDFTAINSVARTDVAAVDTGLTGQVLPWNPQLDYGPGGGSVYAVLASTQGTDESIYIGGDFLGAWSISRPSIIATNTPSNTTAALQDWDAQLAGPCVVEGIAETNNEVAFFGNFTSVLGQPRTGVACVTKYDSSSPTTPPTLQGLQPVVNGTVNCIEASYGGTIYLGGHFTSLTENQTAAATAFMANGIVSLDTQGNVLTWFPNVTTPGTAEMVNCVQLDGTGRIWIGGKFDGTGIAGQRDVAWVRSGWYITTSSLPPAVAGTSYLTGYIQLSEPFVGVTWAVSGPGASWLTMNPAGYLFGTPPVLPGNQPATYFVRAEATYNGETVTRWLSVTVNPPPPPMTVAVTGPATVTEGNGPQLVEWDVTLSQPFSTPVYVAVDYPEYSASVGYDFSTQVSQIIFFPAGAPLPTQLPLRTIATNGLTTKLPVTVYGNKSYDNPPNRDFAIRLTPLTAGVYGLPTDHFLQVVIQEDDPVNPVPEPAYVLGAAVYEDATTLANPQGVVSNLPIIKWEFGSDIISEYQGAWQVQVSTSPNFSSPSNYAGTNSNESLQLPTLLTDGTDYYARVKVWDSTVTNESEWFTFMFRCNAAPLASHDLDVAPEDRGAGGSGTASTSRPMLEWEIDNDADGNRQHVVVTLEQNGGGTTHVLDSRVNPSIFEFSHDVAVGWQTVSQTGVSPNPNALTPFTTMRVRVPASMALSDVQWNWRVDVADPFESVVGTLTTLMVSSKYVIEGIYQDSLGQALGDRRLNPALLPSHTPIASAVETVLSGPDAGTFEFEVNMGALNPGDVVAICVDPTYDPAGTGPVNEYGAVVFRFTGTHMRGDTGANSKITFVKDACLIDGRGMDAFNLSHLKPPAFPVTPIPGFAFTEGVAALELIPEFSRLELAGELRVRGTFAQPGEPTIFTLPTALQELVVLAGGSLAVEEGAQIDLRILNNQGEVVVHSAALLVLHDDSTSEGNLTLLDGSVVSLEGGDLVVLSGSTFVGNAVITGLTGPDSLRHEGGQLNINGTTFIECVLDIGTSAPNPVVSSAEFTVTSSGPCIYWRKASDRPAQMFSIRFNAGGAQTKNVEAEATADMLTLIGCGGDLAGESHDVDPGESATPVADIVVWQLAPLEGLTAYAGDETILLAWTVGAQTGSNFSYEIHQAEQETGPYTLINTTSNAFYVATNLANDTQYHYFIRIVSGSQQEDSAVVAITPRDAVIDPASPLSVRPNGIRGGAAVGSHTHFSAGTTVSCSTTGVTVPSASILALSPTLLLYDIETNSAPQGSATILIETTNVWAAIGATGYTESLTFDLEVTPPPSPAYPSITFVDDNDAMTEDGFTDGAFLIAVEFEDHGGASIETATFECIVDRDILVGDGTTGQIVSAGTDLGPAGLNLWETLTTGGATWDVDQLASPIDPLEEHVSPGELIVSVRVANEFGYRSPWYRLRIFVTASGAAFVSADLKQGGGVQTVTIFGADLAAGADDVLFDDTEISVISVTSFQPGTSSYSMDPDPTWYEVELTASKHAKLGRGQFQLINSLNPSSPIAVGYYRMTKDATVSGAVPRYPDPLATKGAVNVTLQNGAFSWSSVDIATDGRAFPIVWDRTYRSDKHERETPLGNGWIGTYLQYIDIEWVSGVGYTNFTWHAPDGGEYEFVRYHTPPEEAPNYGFYYTTPVGLSVRASVLQVKNVAWANVIQKIGIQTGEGLVYVFDKAKKKNLTGGSVHRWFLSQVEDTHGNKHLLEYDKTINDRLIRIEGDAVSGAISTSGVELSTVYGDALELDYYGNGQIKEVRRVWRRTDYTIAKEVALDQYVWFGHPGTTINTIQLESVRYWYDVDKNLTVQRLPEGTRHGTLYNGYKYEQFGGAAGSVLLSQIFPPSRTNATVTSGPGQVDSSSGPPSLQISYAPQGGSYDTYRVVQQNVFEENPNQWRTWQVAYTGDYPPNGGAQGALVTRPDGSQVVYVLSEHGQATSVSVLEGSVAYTTEYEYHALTRATTRVTRPKGDTTYFLYSHGQSADSGTFSSVIPQAGNKTKIEVAGISNVGQYEWQIVKLEQGALKRYAVVLPDSTATDLYVSGNLQSEGLSSGTVTIFKPNDNPLARYEVFQQRECETTAWTSKDLVTTYSHADRWFRGKYVSFLERIVDPYGGATTFENPQLADTLVDSLKKPAEFKPTTAITKRTYKQADGTSDTATAAVIHDKYGRIVLEQGPHTPSLRETRYSYYADDKPPGSAGKLASVKVTESNWISKPKGTSWPTELKTTYEYDAKGNLKSVLPPRGSSAALAAPYSQDDFKTEYFYNDARQLYRVKHPAVGPDTNAVRPETWFYHDKDGRTAREVSLLVSTLSGMTVASVMPSGEPQNFDDTTDLTTVFKRPTSRRGAGWLHTVYEYNAAGEVIKQTNDIDSSKTASSEVQYDKMGRVTTETDAEGRTVHYTYNPRGLTSSTTLAQGTQDQARYKYEYDANGNLTAEIAPDATTVSHLYDGFNRLTGTVSLAAGGALVTAITYPEIDPNEPLVVKKQTGLWGSSGFADTPRETWTELDELGRPRLTRTLAMNAANTGKLVGAETHEGKHWAVTASNLDPLGVAFETWARLGGTALPSEKLEHNGYGWLARSLRDSHLTASYSYDADGNVVEIDFPYVGASGITSGTEVVFNDPAGFACWSQKGGGVTTNYARNNLGWVEKVTDGADRIVEIEYNFAGWPVKKRVGKGSTFVETETAYDKTGLVKEEFAERGTEPQTTTYKYDKQGRLSSTTRPGMGVVDYYYDAVGRPTIEYRRKEGLAIEQNYDFAGNLVERVAWSNAIVELGFVFGNLKCREKFTYNEFGEILSAETFDASDTLTSKLDMEYNSLGLIEQQMLTVCESGSPVAVSVPAPHSFNETVLGFRSLYQGQPWSGRASWTIDAIYDALGRERATGFWDGRWTVTSYKGLDPYKITEYTPELNQELELMKYEYAQGLLAQRTFGNATAFTFEESPRRQLHAVNHERSPNEHNFAGVKVRYDYSGNPVYVSSKQRGGVARVLKYDHAGRLDVSVHGHFAAPPGGDLPNSHWYVASPETLADQQWRRHYTQDDVDNVTDFQDFLAGSSKGTVTNAIKPESGNLIASRTGYSQSFMHDNGNRIAYDPTTQLSYEYNYRGQVTAVKTGADISGTEPVGGTVIRKITYDAFGRMVHQVDAPGEPEERGTIFIPNIGFGGDGAGADCAGEISYTKPNGTDPEAAEILQYTYGMGAVGGGIGYKRLLEFVAYGGSDFKPYRRYLHEDTMGSTLATTDQFGDRIDEYDYTDYGVPVHAPIRLDGRHIASIVPHTTYPGVSVVNLSADVLDANELLGCEFRAMRNNPSSADDVYLTGTVISHLDTEIHIHDPQITDPQNSSNMVNAIAYAWGQGEIDGEQSAVFDLHEGFLKGVIDSNEGTGNWTFDGWVDPQTQQGEGCTFLRVEHAPFSSWMSTPKSQEATKPLKVTLVGPAGQTLSSPVTVLGISAYTTDDTAGFELVVRGTNLPAWVGTGCWYYIDGTRYKRNVVQSGTWTQPASGGSFTLDKKATLTPSMKGWILQPDVNQAVYLPIMEVSTQQHTFLVSGDYSSLGAVGTRFRIYAPPGVATGRTVAGSAVNGATAGALSRWVSADSSRCLYMGYRYESPLAGFWDGTTAQHRQTGTNFAGQHYTLHRHYDPVLMRFTSPDPIAAEFWNLNSYSGNNPAGAYDPDGLNWLTNKFVSYILDRYQEDPNDGLANYVYELGVVAEGASWRIANYTPMGMATFDADDEAAMQRKHRDQGTDLLFNRGADVGGGTYVTVATLATGGAAAELMGAYAVGSGVSAGFTLFAEATVGSMAGSITYQTMTTGHARADVMAADTLVGIGTAGVLGGSGAALGALRNNAGRVWGAVAPRLSLGNYQMRPIGFTSTGPNMWPRYVGPRNLGSPPFRGFGSYSSFKNTMGSAGNNMQWHHIVEQTRGNVARFGPGSIHNLKNVFRLNSDVHRQVSAYYSSIDPAVSSTMTVRQAIANRSFAAQRKFGRDVLKRFGVSP